MKGILTAQTVPDRYICTYFGEIINLPAKMTSAMDDSVGGASAKVVQPKLANPKLRTHLHEYGRRRRTDGPYADNLEVDALVVGGGFAGVFMFWSLRKVGLKTVLYEAGTDLGGTWRWNCYRQSIISHASSVLLTDSSWGYGRFRSA